MSSRSRRTRADTLPRLLVAEHGSARKTLHDHVDGTSFSLAAYGEYLLIDPGYYKPDALDNAKTSQSPSHNVVLIDGRSAPDKGLLTSFGDADAFLRNTHDGGAIEYAEAHQDYQDTHVERSVAFVDVRYFVVGDRLATTHPAARTHAFRLHGHAGVLRGEGAAQALKLPGGQTLETDAELVVLRLEGARPFALMARGTQVLLDGAPQVTAAEATGVAVEE